MIKCDKCKHYMVVEYANISSAPIGACGLKTKPSRIDVVNGGEIYYSEDIVLVASEREDSTGFFGLFRDKTRCGKDAKNFERG